MHLIIFFFSKNVENELGLLKLETGLNPLMKAIDRTKAVTQHFLAKLFKKL